MDRLPYEKDGLLDELIDDKNAGKNAKVWAGKITNNWAINYKNDSN